MPVRKKPDQSHPAVDDAKVNTLIEKGGAVAQKSSDDIKTMLVQLRIGRDVIQRIDRTRKKRMVPPSRHSWMLEAILEKLEASK